MTTAHHREKNPEKVRHLLIENARKLALEKGLAFVSVQQVSRAAGVTKGAFFHHFSSKQTLIDAVFAEMIAELDKGIEAYMQDDPLAHGRFTRAYLRLVMDETSSSEGSSSAIWISAITDETLQSIWNTWLKERIARHHETDGHEALHAVRMAADGIWFALFTGGDPEDFTALFPYLLKSTLP
ncbi:TetR/AcrR family transcriptional regulator [uncultured Cohaesibacter sp.]|uniref:TetR/AcrR family transcriptional regulator n=1 Tax=uncultured Cohaesibacter sp. TaxID=1002546 RepID=UPI0029C843F7|nr:TetR/AcrR family transcriptional regulator [uncultured Cohaesibacter sp.]